MWFQLALLQSNITYMYEKRGPQYHWVVELFERLKLPVFDGVQAALETFNRQRKMYKLGGQMHMNQPLPLHLRTRTRISSVVSRERSPYI